MSRPHDTEIWEHEQRIRADIAANSSLVSDPVPVESLLEEYKDNSDGFRTKIGDAARQFPNFRRVRGDGNCFFRALGFALMEALLFNGTKEQAQQMYAKAVASIQSLVQQGYPEYTVEDFHETYVEAMALATGFPKPPASYDYSSGVPVAVPKSAGPPAQLDWPLPAQEQKQRHAALLAMFREDSVSDSLVYFFRLLTATHFKANAEFFQPFIDNGMTVHDFCSREVEPMARESDQVHITAVSAALDIPIRVIYVDGSSSSNQATAISFQEDGKGAPVVHLLYRPGHYDILYA